LEEHPQANIPENLGKVPNGLLVRTSRSERFASRLVRPLWRQLILLGLGGSGSGEKFKCLNALGTGIDNSAACAANSTDGAQSTAMVGIVQPARQEPTVVSSLRLQSSQLIMSGDMAIFSTMPFA
jgi:hypothetical protein